METPISFLVRCESNTPPTILVRQKASSATSRPLISIASDRLTENMAIVQGEIYYRKDLAQQGGSANRAEYILQQFRQRGTQALADLEGECSVVIVQCKTGQVFMRRDPMGSWPLFWAMCDGKLRVSSNLLMMANDTGRMKLNQEYIADYLMSPFHTEVPTEQTAFQGISRVLPGQTLVINSEGVGNTVDTWDWYAGIQHRKNVPLAEAGGGFREVLREAVQARMACGRVACELSGGMDSSSITALAAQIAEDRGQRIPTISLVYSKYHLQGESEFIRSVQAGSTAYEDRSIEADDLHDFDILRDDLPLHDEPYAWLFRAATSRRMMQEAARAGSDTLLTGLWAEVSLDSSRLYIADQIRSLRLVSAVREMRRWAEGLNTGVWYFFRDHVWESIRPAPFRHGIGPCLRRGFGTWPNVGLFSIPPWVTGQFARSNHLWRKGIDEARRFGGFPAEKNFRLSSLRASAGDWENWFIGSQVGVRHSHPFVDPRVVRYCLALPRELKEVPGTKEPVLQEAMRGILPECVRARRHKRNFNEVYWTGLAKALPMLEEMIARSDIGDLEVFDLQALTSALQQHSLGIGNAHAGSRLNASLSLIAWHGQLKRFMAQAKRETIAYTPLDQEATIRHSRPAVSMSVT